MDLLVVGAGPCGLAAAIAAQSAGLTARVLDAGSVVSTITQYPYYVSFFSTAEKLSLGGVPFVVATEKPSRRDALAYYRAVTRHFALDVHQYERVIAIEPEGNGFVVQSETLEGERASTRASRTCTARAIRPTTRTSSSWAEGTRRPRRRWTCGARGRG